MKSLFVVVAIAFIMLAIVLHLVSQEWAAEVCGNVAFFALVVATVVSFRKPAPVLPTTRPDAIRDQELYEAHYADESSRRSFESASKIDVFAALVRRAHIDFAEKRVCDVGFGTGLLLEYMLQHGAGQLAGVELSKMAVQAMQRRHPSMDFRCESADRTSFDSGKFDVIVCSNVLEHVPNEHAVLLEIARIARSGGVIVIGVPGRDAQPDARHFREYEKSTLNEKLRGVGLEPIEGVNVGSRLARALTPSLPLSSAQDIEDRRKPRWLKLVRRIYYSLWVPVLRWLYAASIRRSERGLINEVWIASRLSA